jgi:hypothetical protein
MLLRASVKLDLPLVNWKIGLSSTHLGNGRCIALNQEIVDYSLKKIV